VVTTKKVIAFEVKKSNIISYSTWHQY